MATENPFKISVSQDVLEHLHAKLALLDFPDELEGAGWDYGVPLSEIRRLVEYWKRGYDWRKQEAHINETLPQFTINIDVDGFGSLNIHYVHQKSATANAVPLLFVHGWPGSFLEVTKILPILTESSPDHPSFHVVAISLPGFTFSEGPKKKGFHAYKYAETCAKLMEKLGYTEYVCQGGDWGSWIVRALGHRYPKSAKAVHTNMPRGVKPRLFKNPILYLQHAITPYTKTEKDGFKRVEWFREKSYGYNLEQSTQPQTIGCSLADSPVGLLAWIYEKMKDWSDNYPWTDDEVLTWVSVYWFSRAGPAASARIYYEVTQNHQYEELMEPSGVPMGFSHFPNEIETYPKTWSHTTGNIVFEAVHTSGGHFAAHEKPELLSGDLRKMFGKGGPAYGVVKGKTGYDNPN